MLNAKYKSATISQIARCTLFLAVLCHFSFVHGQTDESGSTANDTESSAEQATPPDTSKSEPRKAIDSHKRQRELLTDEIKSDNIHWLEATGEKFMALWEPDKTGNPFGAMLILHGEGQSADWPHTVAAIRKNLALYGWATLAINLPPTQIKRIPPRSPKKQTTSMDETPTDEKQEAVANQMMESSESRAAERIRTAVKFLNDQGQYNIVLVGHGVGAARAAKYIDSISAKQNKSNRNNRIKMDRPIRALVFVAARNVISPTEKGLTEYLSDKSLPVMDIYYGDHFLDPLEAKARKESARTKNIQNYYQVKVMKPSNSDAAAENRLTRRIRGFLNKHAKGIEIER